MEISRKTILARITRFENIVRDHAFKGATDPATWEWQDQRYERAKESLLKYMLDLAFMEMD